MTLLFDSEIFSVSEMRNKAFRQIITANAIQQMYDLAGIVGEAFDMYDFQDDPTLVGAINKGTGGVLGNMAWDNIALRTGAGWYVPPQIPGAGGFGMVNDGGATGHFGSVVSHTGNYLDGYTKATFIAIVNAFSDGEGTTGRIIDKTDFLWYVTNNRVYFSNGGGTARSNVGTLIYNYWNVLTLTYDGTQALGNRMKVYINGIDVTSSDSIPAQLVDSGNILYILENAANNRAFNGLLGSLAICPGICMSQAQVQSLVELRGLFQPTVANQPTIITPGHFGAPEYDFDGVASPNSDHLASFQVIPIKTQVGTILMWFSPDDLAVDGSLLSLNTYGATDDEWWMYFRGSVAGDPLDIPYRINGATIDQLQSGVNLFNSQSNFVALTSDGATTRCYVSGVESALGIIAGANNGAWLGDVTDGNVFSLAVLNRAALTVPFNGKEQKVILYDRALSQLEIQQIYARGFGPNGPRWYPSR